MIMNCKSVTTHAYVQRIAFVLLCGLLTCSNSGQSQAQERSGAMTFRDMLEAMIIPDEMLTESIKISERPGLFKPKVLSDMLKIKEDSIRQRIEIMQDQLSQLQKNAEITQSIMQQTRHSAFAKMASLPNSEAQAISFPLPQSRQVAEQLLSSAMLELQKINWDLAAEQGVLAELDTPTTPTKAQEAEQAISNLEVQSRQVALEYATASLGNTEQLFAKGSASREEVAKARAQVQIAENELKIEISKAELSSAKTSVLLSQLTAETKTALARLNARKKTVEQHIRWLQSVMPEIAENDAKLAEADYMQKSIYKTLDKVSDLQQKMNELQSLKSQLNSVSASEQTTPKE